VERVIGGIRRECANHIIVINDWHLRRILKSYFRYYHESRTHLSLEKDAPVSRKVHHAPPGIWAKCGFARYRRRNISFSVHPRNAAAKKSPALV